MEETKGTDRIANFKYTLTNNGGNIKNVFLRTQSYTIFYIPTGIEDEWYIFKYMTNDFDINHRKKFTEEEKGRKFVFYEYSFKKFKHKMNTRNFKLGKYLAKNLKLEEKLKKEVTHSFKNILYITYTDYMGEEQNKIFEIFGSELQELEKDIVGVTVGIGLDAMKHTLNGEIIRLPIDINDTEAVGKALKEEIEKWLEKNKGSKGYKNAAHTFYNYDLIP